MDRLPRNKNGILFRQKNARIAFVYNEDETLVNVIMRRLIASEEGILMESMGLGVGFGQIIRGRILQTHFQLSLDAFAAFWAAFESMAPQPYTMSTGSGKYTFIKSVSKSKD